MNQSVPELSIVIPIFNEEENIGELYREVREALNDTSFELLFVDDGSTDASVEIIRRLEKDPEGHVRGVFFPQNRGQSAAMLAGCLEARAPLVVTLDGDGQNDPADIPRLIEALGDSDAVVGMRLNRRDTFVRRISSKLANFVRNLLTGDTITDTGCSLKLFKREAIQSVPRFEGMHRFLPTMIRYAGYKVDEIAVNHRPRSKGVSKYGIMNRLPRATLDMLAVCWMRWRWVDLSSTSSEFITAMRDDLPSEAEASQGGVADTTSEDSATPKTSTLS